MKIIMFTFFTFFFPFKIFTQDIKWIVPLSSTIESFQVYRADSSELVLSWSNGEQSVCVINENKFFTKQIDSLNYLAGSKFLARKSGFWGVFDAKLNEFSIPPVYDEIHALIQNKVYKVKKYGMWAVINQKNEKIRKFRENEGVLRGNFIQLDDGEIFVYSHKKWQSLPEIPAKSLDLRTLKNFGDYNWAKFQESGRWCVMNAHGKVIDTLDYTNRYSGFYSGKVELRSKGYETIKFRPDGTLLKEKVHYQKIEHFDSYSFEVKGTIERLLDRDDYELLSEKQGVLVPLSKNLVLLKNGNNCYDIFSILEKKIVVRDVNRGVTFGSLMLVANKDKSLFGVMDLTDGSMVFPIEWTLAHKLTSNISILKKNNIEPKTSILINTKGETLDITGADAKRWKWVFVKVAKPDASFFYVNENFDTVSLDRIDFKVTDYMVGDLVVVKNVKYGLVDNNLNIVLPFVANKIKRLNNSQLYVFKDGDKNALIKVHDEKLDTLLLPEYNSIKLIKYNRQHPLEKSVFLVEKEKKFGLAIWDGYRMNTVVPINYESIKLYHNLFILTKNKKIGVVDSDLINGMNLVLPLKYDRFEKMNCRSVDLNVFGQGYYTRHDKIFKIVENKHVGVVQQVDSLLVTLISVEYDEVKYLGARNYLVKKNGSYGLIKVADKQAEMMIPIQFEAIELVHPKICKLKSGGKLGFARLY